MHVREKSYNHDTVIEIEPFNLKSLKSGCS